MKVLNKLLKIFKSNNNTVPHEKKDKKWEYDYNCKKMMSSPFYSMWEDYVYNRNIRLMIVDVDDYKRLKNMRFDAFNFNNNIMKDFMTEYYLFSNEYPYEEDKEELAYIYDIEAGIFLCSEHISYCKIKKSFDYLVGVN